MQLKPGSPEETRLILELMALPPYRRVEPATLTLGSKWIDMTCAAVLLSRCFYWPRERHLRAQATPYPIDAARLVSSERVIDVTDGRVLVKFTLAAAGRTGEDLLAERRWLYGAALHPLTADYRKNLSDLLDIYMDARESARKRFGNLRPEERAKGDEELVVVATH